MRLFSIRIDDTDGVTVKRLQISDARELDGAAVFGRVCQDLGRRQDGRHVVGLIWG